MVRSGKINSVTDASWRKVTPCSMYDEPGSFSITSQCTSARVQMQDKMRDYYCYNMTYEYKRSNRKRPQMQDVYVDGKRSLTRMTII